MSVPGLPARTVRLRPDDTAVLQALLVAAGPHLEPVVDVGSAANGDLLVELPPARAALSGLLAARERLDPGEAVTLLVPLAEALAAAHAAGVAFGGPGAPAVRLDENGAAFWAAPERPVLRRSVPADDYGVATAADDAAFSALAAAVLLRAGAPTPPGWVPSVEALFAVAEPVPVRFRAPEEAPPGPVATPQRLVPPVAVPAETRATALPAALLARLRASLARVRARVWATAAGAAVLLVLALVLLPGGRGDAGERSGPVVATDHRTTRAPVPSPSRTGVPASVGAAAAVRALLDARARLLAAGDADGLGSVEAAGSPVLAADRASIASGAEPVHVGGRRVVLLSSGGGTALADVGGGTVLAVRQQNGWRLRDVVAEPPR